MGRERSWLSLDTVLATATQARRQRVSSVATGPGGFVAAFRAAGGDPDDLAVRVHRKSGQDWRTRRNGFVARHMAQVENNGEPLWTASGEPTRRHLALAVWAYSPTPARLMRWLRDLAA